MISFFYIIFSLATILIISALIYYFIKYKKGEEIDKLSLIQLIGVYIACSICFLFVFFNKVDLDKAFNVAVSELGLNAAGQYFNFLLNPVYLFSLLIIVILFFTFGKKRA